VHVQDTTISFSYTGEPQAFTPQRSVNDLTRSDFVDPEAASNAARTLGDVTGSQLADGLAFTALTGTDAQIVYSGSDSQSVAARRLDVYVNALINLKRHTQSQALLQAAEKLRTNGGSSDTARRLELAATSLGQQIYQVGIVTTLKPTVIPKWATLLAAALAGAILGLLCALTLGRFDPRIRASADLRSAGVRSVEIDSSRPAGSVQALRALVEVGGIDASGGVVAVVTPSNGGATSVARALAAAFAASGRPTTLLSDSGSTRSDGGGWVQVATGSGVLQSMPRLSEALSGGREGEVTVIDAPGLEGHAQPVIASAAAAVTVLALSGRNTWGQLETGLAMLQHAALEDRLCICLDRSRRATAESVATQSDRTAAAATAAVEAPGS
jgi:hypothetical protein